MAQLQSISTASDRVMAALVSGLEIEFGRGAAEESDFHWDARVEERWIGSYASDDDDEFELDRIEILGALDGKWFVAMMIADGDGKAHGMLGCRSFASERPARKAYRAAH